MQSPQSLTLMSKKLLHNLSVFFFLVSAWWCVANPNHDLMLQLADSRYGSEAVKTLRAWQRLISVSQDNEPLETLEAVNRFFNQRIQFDEDQRIWNQLDYWATPLETMGRRQGDCEDFSIAKYVSLLLAGVPVEQLRMVYVKARVGSVDRKMTQAHMVLAYYPAPNADPLILDNLDPRILPASQRRDLIPVFSFNSAGLWIQDQVKPVGTAHNRLSRWRDLLHRMQAEGL
ncbi:MAG: transglutaminase-like cysteine peptidase [Pseudomonadales bacterium]